MTNNEIVARWMGKHKDVPLAAINYSGDYQCLMDVWVKFRDLKFEGVDFMHHRDYCAIIKSAITDGTIQEAFDELVRGIEWYNSLNIGDK